MNNEIAVLYVWDEENKQVFSIPKIRHKSAFDYETEVTKRMYVYDSDYTVSMQKTYKYGSYLFSLSNQLLGFWEPHNLSDFPAEFRANLLLLGLE